MSAIFASLLGGCSGSGDYDTAPVQGKVVFNGQPVPDATVIFTPQASQGATMSGKSATGTTDLEGKFTLSTYAPNDGAVVGQHNVAVSVGTPDNPFPGKPPENLILEVKEGSNDFTIELTPDNS